MRIGYDLWQGFSKRFSAFKCKQRDDGISLFSIERFDCSFLRLAWLTDRKSRAITASAGITYQHALSHSHHLWHSSVWVKSSSDQRHISRSSAGSLGHSLLSSAHPASHLRWASSRSQHTS